MIDELSGRIRRRFALVRESITHRFSKSPPSYDFGDITDRYRRRLANSLYGWTSKNEPRRSRVLILITPWLHTAVPYLSAETGRALRAEGCEVNYLWDPEDLLYNASRPREVLCIRKVLDELGREANVDVLPGEELSISDDCLPALRELVRENVVRKAGGEAAADAHLADLEAKVTLLRGHLARILCYFDRVRPDFLFLPGGVFGSSGLYVLACRMAGLNFTTYDSGPGELIFTHDSVAAHMEDFGRSHRELYPGLEDSDFDHLVSYTTNRLAVRRSGRDAFRLQPAVVKTQEAKRKFDIFVPLNFRTDTAALQRQKLFTDVRDWLGALLDWVTAQPGVTMVIRQHPCERIPEYRGSDDWAAFLAPYRKKLGARLRFVSAWDQVNSYDLLDHAKVVLPYTSRVGIESAFLGLPVILCAKCFYADLGFTESPASQAGYFSAIRAALDGKTTIDEEARRRASLLYFLVEQCCLCPTSFTPVPSDFDQWVAAAPSELMARENLPLLLDCLIGRVPMSTLLFHRRFPQISSLS